jgi:hypothetical protein
VFWARVFLSVSFGELRAGSALTSQPQSLHGHKFAASKTRVRIWAPAEIRNSDDLNSNIQVCENARARRKSESSLGCGGQKKARNAAQPSNHPLRVD